MLRVTAVLLLAAIAWVGCGETPGSAVDGGADGAADSDSDADTDADGDADADADSDADTDTGENDPAAPLFDAVGVYQTVIEANGDDADVYHPDPPDLGDGDYAFPIALFLQGANVDKQHYSGFATAVAAHGFVVVVPNHESLMGLMAESQEVHDALAQMETEDASEESPVAGALDLDTLVLLGHSQGGLCGLLAVEESCEIPCCTGFAFERPEELAGAALWGTNRKAPLMPIPQTENDGIPVALLQGTLDGMAAPADTQETYTGIQDPPKAYVGVIGANHYGQCDVNHPEGALADDSEPTLEQEVAVETIARWSAMFLRAHVLGEGAAIEWVHETGGPADENVNVVSE